MNVSNNDKRNAMNAAKIKAALADVHAIEAQYGRKKAYTMVLQGPPHYGLSRAEAAVLARALNIGHYYGKE